MNINRNQGLPLVTPQISLEELTGLIDPLLSNDNLEFKNRLTLSNIKAQYKRDGYLNERSLRAVNGLFTAINDIGGLPKPTVSVDLL